MAVAAPARLLGLEWKFGVTAASDELEAVGSSFVQLKLALERDSVKEDVQFELSLPQFYSLLRSLEQAQLQAGGALGGEAAR